MATPWRARLPLLALLVGTLLPDLIDKPLYYGLAFATGKHGADLGLFSGTRSIGHSLLFLALLLIASYLFRSRILLALAVGTATHLLLDNFLEPFHELVADSSRIALFFPLYGGRFPVAQHLNLREHLFLHLKIQDLAFEVVGLILLAWSIWLGEWRKWTCKA